MMAKKKKKKKKPKPKPEPQDETCPYCGLALDRDEYVIECPECFRPGCLQCMPCGVNCLCPQCEEAEDAKEDQ